MKFKEGNIVAYVDVFENDNNEIMTKTWVCILINITQKDLDEGFNSDRTGLHLLRGYWYKLKSKNYLDRHKYGKTEGHISYYLGKTEQPLTLVRKNLNGLKNKQIKSLLT